MTITTYEEYKNRLDESLKRFTEALIEKGYGSIDIRTTPIINYIKIKGNENENNQDNVTRCQKENLL